MSDDAAVHRTNEDFRRMLLQPSSAATASMAEEDAIEVIQAETEQNAEPEASDWSELRLQRGQLQMQPLLLTGLLRQCGAAVRSLDLSGCREYVNDGVLRSVAAHCTDILQLDISECDVSDAGIMAIASGCAALDRLNVSYCAGVTDEAIKTMLQRGAPLSALDCVGCVQVTDAGRSLLEPLGVVGTGE